MGEGERHCSEQGGGGGGHYSEDGGAGGHYTVIRFMYIVYVTVFRLVRSYIYSSTIL
jgi:hypothetical protein